MDLYECEDYREALKGLVELQKSLGKSVTYSSLAMAMRVQKPYVSKVMSGMADFNSDQLFMACRYLGLGSEETDFLLLLLDFDRALYPERRELLEKRIEKIREEKRDTGKKLDSVKKMDGDEFDISIYADYYLEPDILLTHMMLTVEKFRKNLDLLRECLQMREERLGDILVRLEKMKLIAVKNEKIEILVNSMHLPKDSRLVGAHQQLLRMHCQHRLAQLNRDQKKVFAVTFTSTKKNRGKIEEAFNRFIGEVRGIATKGKAEEVYQLNFDLFSWS